MIIIPYLERPEEVISITNRIQGKMNRIKQEKTCCRITSRLDIYEYKIIEIFDIRKKKERKHAPHEDVPEESDHNHRNQETKKMERKNIFSK